MRGLAALAALLCLHADAIEDSCVHKDQEYETPLDVVDKTAANVDECQTTCQANPSCKSFTYFPNTAICNQHGPSQALSAKDGAIAGPKNCPTAPATDAPTAAPTNAPTVAPTPKATDAPTSSPTMAPTMAPTAAPPTMAPTMPPTGAPTAAPTEAAAQGSSGEMSGSSAGMSGSSDSSGSGSSATSGTSGSFEGSSISPYWLFLLALIPLAALPMLLGGGKKKRSSKGKAKKKPKVEAAAEPQVEEQPLVQDLMSQIPVAATTMAPVQTYTAMQPPVLSYATPTMGQLPMSYATAAPVSLAPQTVVAPAAAMPPLLPSLGSPIALPTITPPLI